MFGADFSRKFGLLVLPSIALPLSACATPSSYMGISFYPSKTDPVLQQQVQLAMSGDKQAQLNLGIRFEEGLGVERDLRKAKKLYRQAATDSGGVIWVYVPPVGSGTSGQVIPVNFGTKQKGLSEASKRLDALK